MTSQDIAVDLQPREVIRKGLASLRGDGVVPAVIHNHGKDSTHVQGDFRDLTKVWQLAGKHHPVRVNVGSKKQLALIRDVDFEPTKNNLRHVVFQAIRQNEKVSAEIPVVLVGEEIPAERAALLVLTQLDYVEVDALPKNLPDELTVDATKLAEVGDRLSVGDIELPEGVTMLTDPETTIATVEMPRDQVAEADAALEDLAQDAADPETPKVETVDQDEDIGEEADTEQSEKE